ncbi:MAG: cytochrome c [Terriglobales bacterium]
MNKQVLAILVVLALGGGIAAEVLAQANPNQLIAQRKGAMNLQVKYFGPVLGMSMGRAPYDAKIVQRNVEYLTVLNQLPWDDFQPHTAGNPNTRTKDDAFKDTAKFKADIDKMQAEVQKLAAVVRGGGDQNAVKPAAQALGRACNSCHESFATFEFRFRVE